MVHLILVPIPPDSLLETDYRRTVERTNMPWHNRFPISGIAPKAWAGICQLLGGAERINDEASSWKDSFIVNLGTPAGHNKLVKPQELRNWHVDGDFFVHYLDSPEQALLVIPMWTDVVAGGGGTMICPSGIPIVAKHLYEHPEGVSPRMIPRAEDPEFKKGGLDFYINIAKSMPDEAFVEVTGVVGDVYLLHPLMVHSASNNMLRKVRVITNPPVGVKKPFQFDREDGDYSLVERKTMKALGKERLEGWKITGDRQTIVPESAKIKAEMKRQEEERLRKLQEASGVNVRATEVDTKA